MEGFQQVATIGFRNKDGSYRLSVPLYVKVSELTKNGLSEQMEELLHEVSETMVLHYDHQIREYIQEQKSKQGGNESNGFCGNAGNSDECVSDEKLHSLPDRRNETRPRA